MGQNDRPPTWRGYFAGIYKKVQFELDLLLFNSRIIKVVEIKTKIHAVRFGGLLYLELYFRVVWTKSISRRTIIAKHTNLKSETVWSNKFCLFDMTILTLEWDPANTMHICMRHEFLSNLWIRFIKQFIKKKKKKIYFTFLVVYH